MPSKSPAQARLMAAAAHTPGGYGGVPQSVGREFNHADMMKGMTKMAKPNASAPLGQGGRFAALKNKLANRPGVTNPGALAAYIGRKKYGAKKMASMSAHGRNPIAKGAS